MSWKEFLQGAMNPQIQVIAGFIWYFVWEYVAAVTEAMGLGTGAFDYLEARPKLKRLVIGAVIMAVPVAAYFLLVFTVTGGPIYWDSTLVGEAEARGIWYALVAGAAAVGTSTLIHAVKLPERKPDATE
jgi:hypothetical protein